MNTSNLNSIIENVEDEEESEVLTPENENERMKEYIFKSFYVVFIYLLVVNVVYLIMGYPQKIAAILYCILGSLFAFCFNDFSKKENYIESNKILQCLLFCIFTLNMLHLFCNTRFSNFDEYFMGEWGSRQLYSFF
jgi:Na+/H+ antiporter NhaC